jgi:hypothetical protein
VADLYNLDVGEVPDIEVKASNAEDEYVVGAEDIMPINGQLSFANVPRLFPKWMFEMMKQGRKFSVLGNQSSDMETLSMKLYYDLNGFQDAWSKYGDIALFSHKLGWVQYHIDPSAYFDDGYLRLTTDKYAQMERNAISYDDAELIFYKTKFSSWINFPWFFNSIKGNKKFSALTVADFYIRVSSANLKLAED